MTKIERLARFRAFYTMRLKGESDVTYRAHDLLGDERYGFIHRPFKWMCRDAGLDWPIGGQYEVLTTLQRYLMDDGYGVVPLDTIELLIREYYVYNRIRYRNYKWKYRDPEESDALARTTKSIYPANNNRDSA